MSEHELYDIARQRIDKRNRRWTFWAVDLMGLILSLAALILLGQTEYDTLAVSVFLAWGGVFTFHTIMAAMAQSRDGDIEGEVTKLRDAAGALYEKPKRMELTEDGEIVEHEDWAVEEAAKSRLS